MFCIKCGQPAVAGNFCQKCFLEKEKLFEIEDFTTKICPACGNYEDGNIEDQINSHIKTKNTIKSFEVKHRQAGNRIYAKVTCKGIIKPLKSTVTEDRKVIVTLKRLKCENCIKLFGNYHEAVFQIRGEQKDRILNKVRKFIPDTAIVSIQEEKTGYNVRIIDKKLAMRVIKYLREYFSIVDSYKLVGEKKGKKIYRNYYAIR